MAAYADLTLQERMLLKFEVEEFLFTEAELLDSRQYDQWLQLLTEDIHYWAPIRRTTTAKEVAAEFTRVGDMAWFDDDKATLQLRINRLSMGRAWAEDPPSRSRRLLTNIRIMETDGHQIRVSCNFHLYRTRLNSEEDSWLGRREDVLRRVDGQLMLSRRHIYLEQTVLLAQNLSTLF